MREEHSDALRTDVQGSPILSSGLARTELLRAAARRGQGPLDRATQQLRAVRLIAVSPELLDAAGRLPPSTLRSLDAIHVQSALLLGDELGAFITYDERMHQAASAAGLPVQQPGFR